MAKNLPIPTPPANVLTNALWVAIVLAAAKFVLTNFGGRVGSRLVAFM